VRFHAEKPDVEHLLSIASQLEELGCTPVLVADSNLFSRLANHPTQQRLYDALCRDGRISVAAHETSADLEIMRFAGQRHAAGRRVLVLSRDRFNWDRQRERWEKRIGAIAFAELLATRDRLRKDNLFYAFSVVGGSARLSQEFEHRVRELQRQTKAS
jgi:hypothetical protein